MLPIATEATELVVAPLYTSKNNIPAIHLIGDVTVNNAFNVCAAIIGQGKLNTLVLAVFKAPRTSVNNVEAMCVVIDKLACHFNNIVMTGDFNFPSIRWNNTHTAKNSPHECILRRLVSDHNLSQIFTHLHVTPLSLIWSSCQNH